MKFGTSGLRGLVADLEGRATSLYATAFARHLFEAGLAKAGEAVLVGRDFRSSSPSISATALGALSRAGFVPVDCGTLPTPALALYGLKLGAPALMVTGSHIPDDRNGIKFYRPDGEIDKQDELRITAIAAALDDGGRGKIDCTTGTASNQLAEATLLFMKRYESVLPAGSLSKLKVGVYQHSTVARDLLVNLLENFGATVVPLGRSEHFVPVDTEAVSPETIRLMKTWTGEYGLDAIVSADGDGDRPLVADETGEPLRGDVLGLICAVFLGASVVVTPVTSNSGIEAAGPFEVLRTKVGSPFVIAGMLDALKVGKDGIVGFEANGGLLTATPFKVNGEVLPPLPTRDSFLPILAALFLLASKNRPLSQIVADFALPYGAAGRLQNFPVDTSSKLMAHLRVSDDNLSRFLAPIAPISFKNDIDGIRATLTTGQIIHLRPSGNAPEMRCYVEAENESSAKTLLQVGLNLIHDWASKRAG